MTQRAELPISLDFSDSLPIYVQIARALAGEIRRGRLRPGAALPGTRSLAEMLGVHRNTALAAYAELVAEGWAETRPGGGTFVSRALPEVPSRRKRTAQGASSAGGAPPPGMAKEHAYALAPELDPIGTDSLPPVRFQMFGGSPDLRLLSTSWLARAHRRALARHSARLLDYGMPGGEPSLRAALAALVARRRGLAASAENVLVTRGSQGALYLIARALCAPGTRVAVEDFGYRPAWRAFRAAGAELIPIRVDAHGLVVSELAHALAEARIQAVYVTPHHQYPTTAVLAPARRLELLALAARERIAIIEDDYDHEFHYEGRPVLPLASMDERGSVIYVGTLSKVLAPGLRIGYLVAPERLVERLERERLVVDRQGDHALEAAIAEVIEQGELERHVRKMQLAYRSRRDVLLAALAQHLGDRVTPIVPTGGMALWTRTEFSASARGRAVPNVDTWRDRALECGVLISTAREYAFDGRSRPFARLGFAACSERELEEAVRRLASAWPKAQ